MLVGGPVAQEKQGIWVISVIGATLRKLRDDAYDASLSPDGSQIVFRDALTPDIWIMGVDGGQSRSLIKPEAGFYLFWPAWFHNGQRIAYFKYRALTASRAVISRAMTLREQTHNYWCPTRALLMFCLRVRSV